MIKKWIDEMASSDIERFMEQNFEVKDVNVFSDEITFTPKGDDGFFDTN